jgi:hypothetical protein
MPLSRIAGGLVAGAAALLAATLVIALGGGSVSVRGDGPGQPHAHSPRSSCSAAGS